MPTKKLTTTISPQVIQAKEAMLFPRSKLSDSPAKPRTGVVLMLLRKLITDAFGQDWHSVARLRPLNDDDDAPFQVYAITPQGREWVGEYETTLTPDDLAGIVGDLKAVIQDVPMAQGVNQEDLVSVDADGTPTVVREIVGQWRKIQTAKGIIEVEVKDRSPKETYAQEESRVEAELAQGNVVCLVADDYQSVTYNGISYEVLPGENWLPKPIADIYLDSRKEQLAVRARMRKAVRFEEEESYILATRRGLR